MTETLQVTNTEAAIAIASIEADAAITINAQNNDTALAIAETHAETEQTRTESNEECLFLRAQNLTLQETVLQLETRLASLQPVSSPEEQTEVIAEEVAEQIAEDLTPLFMSEETVLTPTEATDENADESPALPPVLEINGRPLFQLV